MFFLWRFRKRSEETAIENILNLWYNDIIAKTEKYFFGNGGDNVKISTKGRYALRLVIDLAMHTDDGFVTLKDIAARQNISKKYLEQIVPMLNRSGILKTNRGYQGGYKLARSPENCTVGEILKVTEGDLAPVSCLENEVNECPRADRANNNNDYVI